MGTWGKCRKSVVACAMNAFLKFLPLPLEIRLTDTTLYVYLTSPLMQYVAHGLLLCGFHISMNTHMRQVIQKLSGPCDHCHVAIDITLTPPFLVQC